MQAICYGVEAHRSEGLPGGRIMADMRQMNTSPRANLPLSWAFDKRIAAITLREHTRCVLARGDARPGNTPYALPVAA
jgi:hypothetical protein